jgi:hypothetical protein
MAASQIYACRGASHGASAVDGVTRARITVDTKVRRHKPSAGESGPAGRVITGYEVMVELTGTDYPALIGLIGATAANLVLDIVGDDGANEEITITNVEFVSAASPIEAPDGDQGGDISEFAVAGYVAWGESDTLATVLAASVEA